MYEGEDQPVLVGEEAKAMRVFRMLANGMGGIDWSGLDLAAEKYRVENLDDLIDQLVFIKSWRRKADDDEAAGKE